MKKTLFILVAAALAVCVSVACLTACGSDALPLPEEVTLPEVLEKGGYELVWGDEFDGDQIDYTKWRVGYKGGVRRAGYYLDTEDAVFVKDGALTIRTRYMEDGVYGPGWYTSWVDSAVSDTVGSSIAHSDEYRGFSGKYGYYEVRCITPPSVGIWSAFWLMPVGDFKDDVFGTGEDGAEIDIFESPFMYWKEHQNVISHAIHVDGYGEELASIGSDYIEVENLYDEFHTFGLKWDETGYTFYVDGYETALLLIGAYFALAGTWNVVMELMQFTAMRRPSGEMVESG